MPGIRCRLFYYGKEYGISTNELTTKIREYRELQALIEEVQAEAEAIKDTIKAHMGAQEALRAGKYRV